ncbi:MAG: hypothetical protein U0263_32470 [Polyangiaceae bacterium]
MRQECGHCHRSYALAFDHCPFCQAKAGTKPVPHPERVEARHERAADPRVDESEAARVERAIELEDPPVPERAMEPDVGRDVTPEVSEEHTKPLDLEEVEAVSSPRDKPREPTDEAQAAVLPRPPPIEIHTHIVSESASVGLLRILTWIGVACFVLGLGPVGCWKLAFRHHKVEIAELSRVAPGTRVELIDGVADWNGAMSVDLGSTLSFEDPSQLSRRGRELVGHQVSVEAPALAAYMYKQYRVLPDGKREEMPGLTRVYLPLALDNSLWAVTPLLSATGFDHPEVRKWREKPKHTGVVQLLKDTVSLEEIRNPERATSAPSARTFVPEDALAIVAVESAPEEHHYSVARIAGTQGRYIAVSTGVKPGADQALTGELHPCPSKTCDQFTPMLPTPPAAVLVVGPKPAFPWTVPVALFMLLGLAIAVGSTLLRKRLEDA